MCTTAIAWLALTRAAAPEPAPRESDDDAYRTVVRPIEDDAQTKLDRSTPGFATAIDVESEQGARPADGLPELLARTPGATVRSLGGLGQFASISLRGSSPQQVAVFLDGVPIDASLAGLVDLSAIPLDSLSRVEVYRGHVPAELGGAVIGGAIDLVGAAAEGNGRVRAGVGGGSFGARQARVSVRAPVAPRVWLGAVAGYAGAAGNFPYYDDGGTPAISGDDGTQRRTANDYDRAATQLRVDTRRGPTRIAAQTLVLYKTQGIPGRGGLQARDTRLDSFDARLTTKIERDRVGRPGGRLTWVAGLGAQHLRFSDPAGEVGLAIDDQRMIGVDTFVSPRLRMPLWRGAFLRIVGEQRTQWVDVDERAPTAGLAGASSGDAQRTRLWFGGGLTLEQFLIDNRWLVSPTLRVDALDSRFAVPPGEGEQDDAGRDTAAIGWSPRIGTRLRLAPGVELRASGGRYFRPPTLLELFGDRGYIVGNEGLRPERGTAIDGGLVLDRSGARHHVYAQLAGFWTGSEDLIQWIAAGPVTRPANVAGAVLRGLEASVSWTPVRRILIVAVDYTFLDTKSLADDPAQDGQPLPGRPRHDLFTRASVGRRVWIGSLPVEPRVFYTVDFVSGTRLDPSGRFVLPPRALQGLGAELYVAERARIAAEVRNLLDVRTANVTLPVAGARPMPVPVSDFLGYPLPGRSVWVTASIDYDLPGRRR